MQGLRVGVAVVLCGACTTIPPADGGLDGNAPDASDGAVEAGPPAPVQVEMDFTRASGFFSAPFPSEDRRTPDGHHVDVHDYPNRTGNPLIQQVLALIASDVDGFAATAQVAFTLTGAAGVSNLPDVHTSLQANASVFLMSVDAHSPDYLHRYPVSVSFAANGGIYGAQNLLTALPQQGIPLRPGVLYAAVVLRSLGDAWGRPLDTAPAMAQLVANTMPQGMSAAAFSAYETALGALSSAHVDMSQIAGLAVYRTAVPATGLGVVRTAALAGPLPIPTTPFAADEVFPTYCVYHTTVQMPEYQGGTPPYATTGGGWVFDSTGAPVLQRMETANLVVTIPRTAMPTGGYPTVVFIRTGAGGDRPLVDRGVQATPGGPPIVAGSGPAQDFASVGFAGVSVDGPLGGLRNTTMANEDYTIFNISNPSALRDNLRQSAMELSLLAHALPSITVNASNCQIAGGGPVGTATFDTRHMALFGHSMGSTISPLVLAYEPLYRAGILSGAGGSWIENLVYKQSPLNVRPIFSALLGYASPDSVNEHDPAANLLQWAGEPADPPLYARYIVNEPMTGSLPRQVFMVQGIVDTYILPNIANATSLSIGLDLGGTELDTTDPRLAPYTPIGQLLDLSGRSNIPLPASGNISSTTTALVVQAQQDSVEDGHEVIFQRQSPKHQYRCYLQSFLAGGATRIPVSGGGEFDACP